jgi:suppressor for copper-sensitivity B
MDGLKRTLLISQSLLVAFATFMLFSQPASAQKTGGKGDLGSSVSGLSLPALDTAKSAPTDSGPASQRIQYEARYELEQGNALHGRVMVTATLAPGWHTYSTTQPPGGPYATSIKLKDAVATPTGPFVPDRDPKIGKDEVAYGDLPLEEFYESVTWTAPIELSREIQPQSTSLAVNVDALVCERACEPVRADIDASFAGYFTAETRSEELRVNRTHAVWSAQLEPAQVAPGQSAVIKLTVENDPGYHVYQFVPGDEETNFRTLIVASRKSGLKFGAPTTEAPLEVYPELEEVKYHGGKFSWTIPLQVPDSAGTGELPFEIMIGFMTCNEGSCDEPSALSVQGSLTVADSMQAGAASLQLTPIDYRTVVGSPNLASWIDDISPDTAAFAGSVASGSSDAGSDQALTAWHLLAALAGGFILNFMPCVLPVIGLKVMSFVDQAGNSHRRVVALNLAYVAGILAVMMILAILTVAAKMMWGNAFGWGEQFTHLEFKVVLACLVFAMALSFLGVWEIPIPGFATSGKSGELMQREGLSGAFLKGVLTTVLATPCSGPLLGSLFGLSLVLSAAGVVILYLVVGLGLALPFLVLCFYPGFIKLLPKPGAWMETLKQALAFPLLLTAVFFVASINQDYRIATLILLIVVWFACWLIGRVPSYSDSAAIRNAWLSSVAIIALGAFVSFSYFGPLNSDLKWVPYNEAELARYRAEGKTVMLDFTANWCLNCQINTRVAIDKQAVAQLVERNDVVPMLADWTDRSDAIRNKLEELDSNSIPLLVIFPPAPDAQPILLRDLLTESQVIEALQQAGPSLDTSRLASALP